ncbi:MAG: hypothetical protein O3B73_05780 [bacterium]|nr:hypothetical protein [bacterium]
MFVGHFGVGLAAKSVSKRTSLGTLFLAAQFVDLLWPILLMAKWESVEIAPGHTAVTPLNFVHYPISHSLLMCGVWAFGFAGVYALASKDPRGARVCGAAVMSHWILDFVTHRPDLPLFPGSDTFVGLGLWYSVPATIAVEGFLFAAGIWLYTRCTRSRNRVGTWGFWSLLLFLVLIYIGNLFGDPPPNAAMISWVGNAQWFLIIWAYWVDRHREVLAC